MHPVRHAAKEDLARIAEILVFNYRLCFYPFFRNDGFYFGEMQVPRIMEAYRGTIDSILVYDDGVVKGFIRMEGKEIRNLFVEPVLQGHSIGSSLLRYAVDECGADHLWTLEMNERAITFYERHGFVKTGQRRIEEGTEEYLVCMRRPTRSAGEEKNGKEKEIP